MATPQSNGKVHTIPAVSYLRYSPRPVKVKASVADLREDECDSIPVQKERCKRYAAMWGYEIYKFIEDPDSSAGTALQDREKGAELLKYVQTHQCDHIIVQRIDRLFRNTVDGLETMKFLTNQGIHVHFADEGGNSINTTTSTGRFIFTILLGRATYERELIGERTSIALLDYQRRGKRISKNAPYGKMFDPNNPDWMIDDPKEQNIIGIMLRMRESGWGSQRTATFLDKNGFKGRGYRWNPDHIAEILYRYDQDMRSSFVSNAEKEKMRKHLIIKPSTVNHVKVEVPHQSLAVDSGASTLQAVGGQVLAGGDGDLEGFTDEAGSPVDDDLAGVDDLGGESE